MKPYFDKRELKTNRLGKVDIVECIRIIRAAKLLENHVKRDR